ncbi:hypothetical protein ZOSMA_87G00590 [Zostera marina]|uniref:DUF7792 domain-containing protein n=1 Tax=Zostera marina TaxID=29655 RepID=A0A0K9NL20_ZOSMR|nr:hypothetical protein ZOSMA_87G00590 [Zostera marina]
MEEEKKKQVEEEEVSFMAKSINLLNNVSSFALRIYNQSPSFTDYGRRPEQEVKMVEKFQFSYLMSEAEEVAEEVKKVLIFKQECSEIGKIVDELLKILNIHRQIDAPQFPPIFFQAHSDCSKSIEDALTLIGDCVNESDAMSMNHLKAKFPKIMSVMRRSILDMKFFMFVYPMIILMNHSSDCFVEQSVVSKNYPENYNEAVGIFARWSRSLVDSGSDLSPSMVSALLSIVESGSVTARFEAIEILSDVIKYKDVWTKIHAERADKANSKLQEKKIAELLLKMNKDETDDVLDEFIEFYKVFTSDGGGNSNQEVEEPLTSSVKQLVEVAFEGHDWKRIDAVFAFKTFCDVTSSEELQSSIPDILVFLDDSEMEVANATALALLTFVQKDVTTLGYYVCLNILESGRIPALVRIVNCTGLFCEGFYLLNAIQNEFKRDRLPKTFFNDEVKLFELMNAFEGMVNINK